MKQLRLSYKDRCLAKNPNLVVDCKKGIYHIISTGKNGVFMLGEGKTEDAAWQNCAQVWYNLKN